MSAGAAVSSPPEDRYEDSRISAILQYLHVQPLDSLPDFHGLAAGFNMSESYLRHKFKTVVGLPFGQYVRRLRFQRAKVLLEGGDVTVKRARLEVGMLDHSSFARAYKEYFGETPTTTKRRADGERSKLVLISPPDCGPVDLRKPA